MKQRPSQQIQTGSYLLMQLCVQNALLIYFGQHTVAVLNRRIGT